MCVEYNIYDVRMSYSPVVSTQDKLEEPLPMHNLQLLNWRKEHILISFGERTLSILLHKWQQKTMLQATKSYCISKKIKKVKTMSQPDKRKLYIIV